MSTIQTNLILHALSSAKPSFLRGIYDATMPRWEHSVLLSASCYPARSNMTEISPHLWLSGFLTMLMVLIFIAWILAQIVRSMAEPGTDEHKIVK